MTGVHIIALVSALVTLTVIIELSRRRHLHEKYAIMWLAVAVVIAVFAVFPGLFNSLAHSFGVKNPPDLLTVMAALFLLILVMEAVAKRLRSAGSLTSIAFVIALLLGLFSKFGWATHDLF